MFRDVKKLVQNGTLTIRNGLIYYPHPWDADRYDTPFEGEWTPEKYETARVREFREAGVTEIVIPVRTVSDEEFEKACAPLDENWWKTDWQRERLKKLGFKVDW